LVDALLAGRIVPGWPDRADPLSLSAGTIFLPTRRAARELVRLLADRLASSGAVLMPRILPLGDIDEAEEAQLFETLAGQSGTEDGLKPPEVSATRRRLLLARLVQAWAKQVDKAEMRLAPEEPLLVPASPADALALAGELGALIDTLVIHGRTCADLHGIVPEQFDTYRRIAANFLAIAAEYWPAQARELGVMDAAERRHRVLVGEAGRLAQHAPDTPMIVAGSTGSMPATAALIAAIARLPRGAAVLPGLDPYLDADAWSMIPEREDEKLPGHPGHPQAMLEQLLAAIGIGRAGVERLGQPAPALAARERFLSEALRPAETTERWAERAVTLPDDAVRDALAGVAVVEAADDREEALAIAAALRHALEDPAAHAALVTPDRTIAERVSAELLRWGIDADDSAGQPLGRSAAGVLARLAAAAAASDFAAVDLLALLDHPLCRFGLPRETVLMGRSALEIGVLRGPAVPDGLAGLRAALESAAGAGDDDRKYWPRPRKALRDRHWNAARALLDAIGTAFGPFRTGPGEGNLVAVVPLHAAAVEAALAGPDAGDPGPSFEVLRTLFDEAGSSGAYVGGSFADYPAFFAGLAAGAVVRRADCGQPRLHILGLLEARLLSVDLAVLAWLDEKTWRPEARADAFLNRTMRRQLSLPAPERRLGQTAHDFVQALGAPRAIVTRAARRGGDPTVASRFVQRMRAVAGDALWGEAAARGEAWLAIARQLDRPEPGSRAARRPKPVVPPERQPVSLSVTEVETLVRDPCSIYARHVLKLDPLDEIGASPEASLKGVVVHGALGEFAQRHPEALPADAEAILMELARRAFEATPELSLRPQTRGFWLPRLRRIMRYVASWEAGRRAVARRVLPEVDGRLAMTLADGTVFTLRGRADRIELMRDGRFAVVDFKTGEVPSVKQVRIGFSPQLTLEVAMAKAGAFADVPAGLELADLLYVRLSGGAEPGKEHYIRPGRNDEPFDPDGLAQEHLGQLKGMLDDYRAGRPFLSRPYAKYAKRYADYDHLARVKEWSLGGDEDSGEGA
jgi:ATP-dependent helicase/nuclease subunit B